MMINNNCLDCLYGNYSEFTILLQDLNRQDCRVCEHPNSAYSGELVDDNKTCKFFINEKEYFFNKDRIEKIEELRSKFKKRR